MNDVISHHMINKIKLNKEIELIHILNANTFLISHNQIRNSNNSLFNAEKDKSDNINKNEKDKINDEIIKNNKINQIISKKENNFIKNK